ncbi:Cyclin-dependent kinase 2-associated protein 1 [Myotis brandtii]|uniref:Cyclin-dependent kinase 2-associated protein 1 n=1 Tax=Myotis brandtii TaxID=109478 RepID=S7Q7C7_MYOBR|nr:Cyclin-dependent kinase 2-associated protein 1 [Myotis brandtii]
MAQQDRVQQEIAVQNSLVSEQLELSVLYKNYAEDDNIYQQKIKYLHKKYLYIRKTRPDGYTQGTGNSQVPQSKYTELLDIIKELGKEIRPMYLGSKSAMERLKQGIIHERGLVQECLAEREGKARS